MIGPINTSTFKSFFLTTALLAASFGCGHIRSDQKEFQTTAQLFQHSGDIESMMDSLAEPLIASGRNIGMVVGVTTPDGDYVKSYGRISRDKPEPMPKDALFQIGSITKSFTALLMAQYEQEGIIRFEDPITSLIPDIMIAPGSELGKIKFGELPSHTSGLPQEGYTLDLLWGVTSYLLTGENLYRYFSTTTLDGWIRYDELKLPHDKSYSYSNVGLTVLGWVLGNYEKKGLRHHLRERIFKPLHLTHTDITLTDDQVKSLTPGYAGDLPTLIPRHRKVEPWLFDEGISGSGGLHSTAADLLKYCRAAIGRDKTVLLNAFRRTQQVVAKQPDGEMAYSWFVETLPHTQQKYYHIAGIIGGHTSWVGYDLERGIGVVLLQNSINHDDQLSVPLLDRLVAAQMKKESLIAKSIKPKHKSKNVVR